MFDILICPEGKQNGANAAAEYQLPEFDSRKLHNTFHISVDEREKYEQNDIMVQIDAVTDNPQNFCRSC